MFQKLPLKLALPAPPIFPNVFKKDMAIAPSDYLPAQSQQPQLACHIRLNKNYMHLN